MQTVSSFLIIVFIGGQNGKRNLWYQQLRKAEVNYRQEEKKILDTVMGPAVYDSRIRPSGVNDTDAATLVTVNLFVRSFSKIDDVKMEYTFQITMRQSWMDQRLQYEHIKEQKKIPEDRIRYLTMTDATRIWMPDTFFRNEKIGAFHTILQPNLYIRIFPDGTVLYSIRVSLTASCSMDLALFPLDEQTCNLYIASYGWTKSDLVYSWYDVRPVQILGVTTLLAMSTTQASIQNSLPPVAYTKAIDVWSGVCVVFVFSALLEYALVNYASRSDAQRAARQKERREQQLEKHSFNAEIIEDPSLAVSMDPLMRRLERSHLMPIGHIVHTAPYQESAFGRQPVRRQNFIARYCRNRYRNFQFGAKKIDVFSRFGFPLVFAIFNVWYWSYYLTQTPGKYEQ